MKKHTFGKYIAVILAACISAASAPAHAEGYEIAVKNAFQDTYVYSGGDKSIFYSYEHLEASAGTWAYISFDMSDIKYLNYKATLTLTLRDVVPSGTSAYAAVYGTGDNDWDQSEITGANRPMPTERIFAGGFDVNVPVEIDVTRYVRKNTSKRGRISFVILEDNGDGKTVSFYAKESGKGAMLTIDRNGYDADLYENEPDEEKVFYQVKQDEPEETETSAEPFNREEHEYYVPEPDVSLAENVADIDYLTTTRTAPWMVNYHLTKISQAAAGYAGGECGQFMFCADISPSNPDNMLIGLDTCNVFKSENGGKTWHDASGGLALMGTTDIRFDPDNDNVAYVAACPHSGGSEYNEFSGLWKTLDGGKSWEQLNDFQYTKTLYNGYIIDFGEKNSEGRRRLYTGVYNEGVMYSDDGGKTWSGAELADKGITTLRVFGETLIATTENGVYIKEYGEWKERSNGLKTLAITGLAVDPRDGAHLFCTDRDNLYESRNGGRDWNVVKTKESAGLTTGGFAAVHFNKPQPGEDVIMYIVCTSQTYTLRYSTDYGKTIRIPVFDGRETVYLEDNHGWFTEAFRINPVKGNECMVSVDGELHKGVYEKDGELHLYPSASGISGIRASDFEFSRSNPNEFYIAAIDRGVIKTVDTGKGESYPLCDNLPFEDRYNIRFGGAKTSTAIAVDPRNEKRVIASVGTWSDCVLKESLNGGRSYVELPGTECSPPNLIEFHKTNSDIIYAGKLISYDNGASWRKSKAAVLAVSPFNSDVVYGTVSDKVYVSYNCGKDWECFNNTVISGMQRMSADISEDGKVYVGTFTNGMYIITKDSAVHITEENGLKKSAGGVIPIMDIAQDYDNPKHLLAGGVDNYKRTVSAGLFESYDGGESWRVVDGIGNGKDIWVIEFHPLKKAAYIGTSSGTYVYEYEKWFDRSIGYFNDTAAEDEEINALAHGGIASGYPDGSFKPENVLTRAEFAEFIKGIIPSTAGTGETFKDVNRDDWYFGSVKAVQSAGVMVGNGGFFRPGDLITHEEALTALAKVLGTGRLYRDVTLEDARGAAITADVSDYAKLSVYKCAKYGIAGRDGDKFKFSPKKALTRRDAAILVYRVREALKG